MPKSKYHNGSVVLLLEDISAESRPHGLFLGLVLEALSGQRGNSRAPVLAPALGQQIAWASAIGRGAARDRGLDLERVLNTGRGLVESVDSFLLLMQGRSTARQLQRAKQRLEDSVEGGERKSVAEALASMIAVLPAHYRYCFDEGVGLAESASLELLLQLASEVSYGLIASERSLEETLQDLRNIAYGPSGDASASQLREGVAQHLIDDLFETLLPKEREYMVMLGLAGVKELVGLAEVAKEATTSALLDLDHFGARDLQGHYGSWGRAGNLARNFASGLCKGEVSLGPIGRRCQPADSIISVRVKAIDRRAARLTAIRGVWTLLGSYFAGMARLDIQVTPYVGVAEIADDGFFVSRTGAQPATVKPIIMPEAPGYEAIFAGSSQMRV